MRISLKSLALWYCLLMFVALLPVHAATTSHNIPMDPVTPGSYPVACSNLAHDIGKLNQFGGSLDDYWSGNNGHYVGDILLEPNDTLKISPRIPDEGIYPGRRNSIVDFVIMVCYPTDPSNVRPDYVMPDGRVVPRMQRAGQSPILPDQACIAIYPPPAGCGRWPLLAFSHGLGSSPLDSYSIDFMTRFASQGYIVAAAFHGDGRFLQLQMEDIGDYWYLLRNFDRFVELQALRPLAVKSVIDTLLANPDFGARIDPERIGGIGVSMGGETMTLLLGAQLTDNFSRETSVITVRDPRIKAAVGYIPYAGAKYLSAFGKNNATTSNVRVPYLAISGVDDGVAPMYRMQEAINNFRSAHYQVGLIGVAHKYDRAYADDIFGWAIPFLASYLDCSDIGRSIQDRLLQQKNILGGIDDQLLISVDAPSLCFVSGWNLLGNGSEVSIDVATALSDANRFQTIWKWVGAQSTWAFYAPSLAIQGGTVLADYAASRGYQLLTTIAGGEGFWVNALQAGSFNLPNGTLLSSTSFREGQPGALRQGWTLVSIGTSKTPAGFNAELSTTPPADGMVPTNMTTLWAWDNVQSKWYFYAPSLEAQGGNVLSDYIASKGYLNFNTKILAPGVGFWVNKHQ